MPGKQDVRDQTKVPMEITSTATHLFDKCNLEIVGPLPLSTAGSKYILTFQDDLSKYIMATPISQQDATKVAVKCDEESTIDGPPTETNPNHREIQHPLTSSLLGQIILFSVLFSYTLSLCFSLNVSDQVSHPYKTTGRIIFLYISVFSFL